MNKDLPHYEFMYDSSSWSTYDFEFQDRFNRCSYVDQTTKRRTIYPEARYRENDVFAGTEWPKIFHSTDGGVNGCGHIWTDDFNWTIDAPETPNSILALVCLDSANLQKSNDLCKKETHPATYDFRGKTLTVYLSTAVTQGLSLDLKGGKCQFWIYTSLFNAGTRFHHRQPLNIPINDWGSNKVVLENQEAKWRRSWPSPDTYDIACATLDECLGNVVNFGISFVDFRGKVTGILKMSEFKITD